MMMNGGEHVGDALSFMISLVAECGPRKQMLRRVRTAHLRRDITSLFVRRPTLLDRIGRMAMQVLPLLQLLPVLVPLHR